MGITLAAATLIRLRARQLHRQKDKPVSTWLTDPAQSIFFQEQPEEARLEKGNEFPADPVITIDDSKRYQSIDGFGFALTGGSAGHIMQMSAAARAELLKDLFTTDLTYIGASYLPRVSIGASGLSDHAASPELTISPRRNRPNTPLAHFDLGPDLQDVVPVLREILAIDPTIKILQEPPWSAPAWMKTNHDTRGGSLLPQYESAYARYLVRYILAMQEQGIGVGFITVQNEPLHPGNNPSMYMPAAQQAEFIKNYLGPAFARERLVHQDHHILIIMPITRNTRSRSWTIRKPGNMLMDRLFICMAEKLKHCLPYTIPFPIRTSTLPSNGSVVRVTSARISLNISAS